MASDITFDRDAFEERLDRLEDENAPLWGKMTAQHMVEHIGTLFMLSSGRFKTEPFFDEEQMNENYKKFIESGEGFPKDLKVPGGPDGPIPLRFKDINQARGKLNEAVRAFYEYFEKNPDAKLMHPVMGELNFEQWKRFHYIHTEHHLEQFDL